MTTVAGQLAVELRERWSWWSGWCGVDEHLVVALALPARAAVAAAQLVGDDERVAAATAADVVGALWGVEDPPDEWWRTPLGRACARTWWRDDETVTRSEASKLLGVSRERVRQLVVAGTLDRHPDGGVLRSSVMRRLSGERRQEDQS